MAKKSKPTPPQKTAVECCEGILAILKASQKQLEYLTHKHLDFAQVLRLEQGIRVGGSPERAEIQRMHLLLDARLDHIRQLRAISSLAPLSFMPSDQARIERLRDIEKPFKASPKVETKGKAVPEAEPVQEAAPVPEAEPVQEAAPVQEAEPEQEINPIEEAQSSAPTGPVPIALGPSPIALSGHTDSSPSQTGLSIHVTPAANTPQFPGTDKRPEANLKQLLRTATKAHGEGRLEDAVQAYTDLLDRDASQGKTLLARGRCHLEKKDYSAALSDFRRAQKVDSAAPDPWVALGDLHFARKKYAQAVEAFDKAIALESDHAQARCRRGMAHYHTGLYRQAFLDLQRAHKLDPGIPNIRRLVQMAIRKLEENS